MTLFFNLKQLQVSAGNNGDKLVSDLYKYYLYRIKKNKGYYLPKVSLLGGTSFLLNPEGLFNEKAVSVIHKAQYIILAGKRDYQLYKEYGVTTLDLSYYPDLDTDKIKYNPLLTIKQNKLQFKFEGI